MKQVIILLLGAFTLFSCVHQQLPTPEKRIAQRVLLQVDSFKAACKNLEEAVSTNTNEKTIQQLFLRARLVYKRIEWATEYFVPATSRFVNGPPVVEIEPYSHQVFEPAGLQVIEGYLFPVYDKANKEVLLKQLVLLQSNGDKFKTYFQHIDLLDWQIFDAVKLEVYRVMTLGITGFDNPLTQKSMLESAEALKAGEDILNYYLPVESQQQKEQLFNQAIHYLVTNPDFNTFNRAAFLTGYCNPITSAITGWEAALNIHVIKYNRLLNQDAKTLFDSGAFNVNAYAPNPESFASSEKIILGQQLFADPILSGNGKRSCMTCHQPGRSFTDGLIKNTILGDGQLLQRNTPTLINAALQPSQFYDLRVNTLEDQSNSVVQNELEMHGSMKLSVKRLWFDSTYRHLFSAAYPKINRNGIDTLEVMNALSSYIRSLTKLNSRFDEYMRGNKEAMTTEEIKGFNLFMGKAKCATCHYMPLFNGTFPPRFIKIETEVIGVPAKSTGKTIDDDHGRYAIVPIQSLDHAFKITTVRNAAMTEPYMHNGVFKTLQEVIDFYNKGGGTGNGEKINNQTLPADKLNLSEIEKKEIVSFIGSLNSK